MKMHWPFLKSNNLSGQCKWSYFKFYYLKHGVKIIIMERGFILFENMYINYRWRIIRWMDYILCFSQNILCPSQLYRTFPCLLRETSLPIFVFENYKPLSFCSGILQISFCALHRIQNTVHSVLCSDTSQPHPHYTVEALCYMFLHLGLILFQYSAVVD